MDGRVMKGKALTTLTAAVLSIISVSCLNDERLYRVKPEMSDSGYSECNNNNCQIISKISVGKEETHYFKNKEYVVSAQLLAIGIKDEKIYHSEALLRVNGEDVGTTESSFQGLNSKVIYKDECVSLDEKAGLMLTDMEWYKDESPSLFAVYCIYALP